MDPFPFPGGGNYSLLYDPIEIFSYFCFYPFVYDKWSSCQVWAKVFSFIMFFFVFFVPQKSKAYNWCMLSVLDELSMSLQKTNAGLLEQRSSHQIQPPPALIKSSGYHTQFGTLCFHATRAELSSCHRDKSPQI